MPPVAQPRNRKSHHCGYAYALRLTKQELLPASVNCRLSPTLASSCRWRTQSADAAKQSMNIGRKIEIMRSD